MKYAHVVDDRIDTISYDEVGGWEPVADDVFGGFVRDGAGWKAPLTPAVTPIPQTIIYKADIWRRASDQEAEAIDQRLSAQPIRLRRLWQDSQTIATTNEMYPAVKAAFEAAFGTDRAAELLEPTA